MMESWGGTEETLRTHIRNMSQQNTMGTFLEVDVLYTLIGRGGFMWQDTTLERGGAYNNGFISADESDAVQIAFVDRGHFIPLWSTSGTDVIGLGPKALVARRGSNLIMKLNI
jgi:hypothetical protein